MHPNVHTQTKQQQKNKRNCSLQIALLILFEKHQISKAQWVTIMSLYGFPAHKGSQAHRQFLWSWYGSPSSPNEVNNKHTYTDYVEDEEDKADVKLWLYYWCI